MVKTKNTVTALRWCGDTGTGVAVVRNNVAGVQRSGDYGTGVEVIRNTADGLTCMKTLVLVWWKSGTLLLPYTGVVTLRQVWPVIRNTDTGIHCSGNTATGMVAIMKTAIGLH